MESITVTKSELLGLVFPAPDAAIDQLDLTMVPSDLIEIRSMLLDRLEGPTT